MKRFTELINPENISSARSILIKSIQSQPVSVEATKAYVITKAKEMNNFYKHVTGLDELEYYQEKVTELHDSLLNAQKERREIGYILKDLRGRASDIHDRLHKVKRQEEPALFLQLMQEETDFMKNEHKMTIALTEQERHEREIFTAFTNAIRDSQEKQRNRLEYAKYIGFGLTVLGALASYAITTWRTEDLKNVIRSTIKDDVRGVFVDSVERNLNAIQEINLAAINKQGAQLIESTDKLTKEIENTKMSFHYRFLDLEKGYNALWGTTQQLASYVSTLASSTKSGMKQLYLPGMPIIKPQAPPQAQTTESNGNGMIYSALAYVGGAVLCVLVFSGIVSRKDV